MKIRKKTLLNLLLFAFVLSFFVTPLGQYSKVWLMQLFAFSPEVIAEDRREQIPTYDWRLKDARWEFFNFDRSEGKVVLIDFWAPWCGPCKMMAPAFVQAAAQLEPQVRLAKLNTEVEQSIAAEYGIRSIPTLALFHRGRELARQAGAMSAQDIVRWTRAHLPG